MPRPEISHSTSHHDISPWNLSLVPTTPYEQGVIDALEDDLHIAHQVAEAKKQRRAFIRRGAALLMTVGLLVPAATAVEPLADSLENHVTNYIGNSVSDLVTFRGGISVPAKEQPPIQTDTGTTVPLQSNAALTTILPFDPAQSTHFGPARYSRGITDHTSRPR